MKNQKTDMYAKKELNDDDYNGSNSDKLKTKRDIFNNGTP